MMRFALTAVATLTAAIPAVAQGSRSGDVPPSPDYGTYNVYRSFDGTLLELDGEEGYAVFENEETGDSVRLPLVEKVKLKADKGSRLHGIKNLRLDDFQEELRL